MNYSEKYHHLCFFDNNDPHCVHSLVSFRRLRSSVLKSTHFRIYFIFELFILLNSVIDMNNCKKQNVFSHLKQFRITRFRFSYRNEECYKSPQSKVIKIIKKRILVRLIKKKIMQLFTY